MWRQVPLIGSLGTQGSPERWLVALALLGWSLIAVLSGIFGMAMCMAAGAARQDTSHLIISSVPMQIAMTLLMLPLLAGTVRYVKLRSFECRRRRSVTMTIIGYVGVWFSGNVVLTLVAWGAHAAGIIASALAVASLVLAAVWQISPAKHLALLACHRHYPLYPTGGRADASCLYQGAANGLYCFSSCGPMMLAAMLSPYPVIAMLCVFLMLCVERYERRRPRVETGYALLAAAAVTLATAYI